MNYFLPGDSDWKHLPSHVCAEVHTLSSCAVGARVLGGRPLSAVCVFVSVRMHWAAGELWDGDARESSAPSPLSSLLSLSLFALYSQCELFIHRSARVIIVTVSQHGLPHTDTHRHTHTHTHTQMLCIDICIYRMLRGCKQWTCKCFASLRKRFTHQELKFTVAAHSLSLSLSLSLCLRNITHPAWQSILTEANANKQLLHLHTSPT